MVLEASHWSFSKFEVPFLGPALAMSLCRIYIGVPQFGDAATLLLKALRVSPSLASLLSYGVFAMACKDAARAGASSTLSRIQFHIGVHRGI